MSKEVCIAIIKSFSSDVISWKVSLLFLPITSHESTTVFRYWIVAQVEHFADTLYGQTAVVVSNVVKIFNVDNIVVDHTIYNFTIQQLYQ